MKKKCPISMSTKNIGKTKKVTHLEVVTSLMKDPFDQSVNAILISDIDCVKHGFLTDLFHGTQVSMLQKILEVKLLVLLSLSV